MQVEQNAEHTEPGGTRKEWGAGEGVGGSRPGITLWLQFLNRRLKFGLGVTGMHTAQRTMHGTAAAGL